MQNKINYNLQKKSIIENFIGGGHGPPCPPASPAPATSSVVIGSIGFRLGII